MRAALITQKSRPPSPGEKTALRGPPHPYLTRHGFYRTSDTGLSPESVYLELTKQAKLDRIGSLGCDVFVDDLPEFLAEPSFPAKPWKVLFDPADANPDAEDCVKVRSWDEVAGLILG